MRLSVGYRPPAGVRKRWVLAVGLLAIVVWQMGFSAASRELAATPYRNMAASGVHQDSRFVYFFHYLGLFPVATTDASLEVMSEDGAAAIVKKHPRTLVQDMGWTWCAGDHAKILLFQFDTWLKGAPWNPSVRPFHRLAFTVSLAGLFVALWWVRRPGLGAVAVALLGSNPFQLYEVHARENVHGWPITTAILVLALHVPLFANRPNRWLRWIIPLATGVLVGTIRCARAESAPIMLSALLIYATVSGVRWRSRWAMIGVAVGSFSSVVAGWNGYFRQKQAESSALLARVGGHPFPGEMRMHHHVWHPIWCGLGDFDHRYGYEWEDTRALAYAAPILKTRYQQSVPRAEFFGNMPRDEYYDDAKVYKILPYSVPHYETVIRDKILHDIGNDPLWYGEILIRRVWRLLTDTTPVQLAWKAHSVPLPVPWPGLLAIPLGVLLYLGRERFFFKLLVFTLPTCSSALIVFSGRGMAYYAIYHLLAASILITLPLGHLWAAHQLECRSRRARGAEG